MRIVTAAEMRQIDERSLRDFKLTVPRLMEQAGQAVVSAMKERYSPLSRKTVGVLCGPGHNGGDGFVVARLLRKGKVRVTVVLLADPAKLSPETRKQYARAKAARVRILPVTTVSPKTPFKTLFAECDLWVDALFGTGLQRNLEGVALSAVQEMNRSGRPVVAVDVPSGLSADSGLPMGAAVRAALTVTFGLSKLGFESPGSRAFTGPVQVARLDFPPELLDDHSPMHAIIEASDVKKSLPKYDETTHKGTRGRLVIVAGATGLTGAAALSATAAQRIGAGLVTVACPESLNPILEAKLTEPMTAPVPEVPGGFLSRQALGRILGLSANALVIGPGIGRHHDTGLLLRDLLVKVTVPMVLDADALQLLGGQRDLFRLVKTPVLLTPHPGEAARLMKTSITEIERDRVRVAKQLAAEYNAVVVLKGHHTVIADPKGKVRINPTGSRALATAGTGDVLSGVIGGLLAQKLSTFDAAVAGAFLHGVAGERASRRFGLDGVLAGDLLPILPRVLRQVRGGY